MDAWMDAWMMLVGELAHSCSEHGLVSGDSILILALMVQLCHWELSLILLSACFSICKMGSLSLFVQIS
jgi:hypothetical protein